MCENVDQNLFISWCLWTWGSSYYEKYWGRFDEDQYFALRCYCSYVRYKINKLMFWLENTSRQGSWVDQLVLRVKDSLNRLHDDFGKFMGLILRFHHLPYRLLSNLIEQKSKSGVWVLEIPRKLGIIIMANQTWKNTC